jgi:glycosyltransferase involved in cell wall biosynthesis
MERKRWNILLLHYSAPPIIGGVESVLGHHARLMAAAGHTVRIAAARGERPDGVREFLRIPLVDSLHPDILAAKRVLDSGRVPPEYSSLVETLMDALRTAARNADVLIAHNVCSLNKNLALTDAIHRVYREKGFPRLILWHHDLAWTTERYLPELHPGRPWDLLRNSWPGAIHVVISALRRREFSELSGLPPETIRIIPNGIPTESFLRLEKRTVRITRQLDLLHSFPLLLLPVRITPRKNLELALRTLSYLRASFPSAGLIVTGPIGAHNPNNRDYFRNLLALRSELGLDSEARFMAELEPDALSDPVIADCYRLADALFLPSHEEGFGIPLLEAGLSHRPVFCADLPALRELGGEFVTFFSPDEDPRAVAALIRGRLEKDPVFRFAVRVRSEFDWDRIYEGKIRPLLADAVKEPAVRGSES